jgi:2-oxoglutarate ferredoxin oxidoreductase subunit alpha
MTYKAFDAADKDRIPSMILMDGCIGALMEPVILPAFKEKFPDKSSWITTGAEGRPARFISSFNVASTEPYEIEDGNRAVAEAYERWQKEDTEAEEYLTADAEIVIVAYGVIGRENRATVDRLRASGRRAGLIRPMTVSPFPYTLIENLPSSVKYILCAEMSIPGQMIEDVLMAARDKSMVKFVGRSGGILLSTEEVYERAVALLERDKEKSEGGEE